MRICVVGDDLVAGVGDPRGLGWVGRAIARSQFDEAPTVLTLAQPDETTAALAHRWEGEVTPRIEPGGTNRLIIGIGTADIPAGISTPRTRLNIANVIDRATTLKIPCLVVGPPPLGGVDRQQLQGVNRACEEVCARRRIPFIDTFTPLLTHDQWAEDQVASQACTTSNATLPGQAGYALMTWLVLHEGWYELVGAEPRN